MNDRKILHLVIDLSGFGGAEMTLLRYLSAQPDAASHHRVLALRGIKPGASVGATLHAMGFDVQTLGIERITDLPRGSIALLRALRASHATVLSAWLYYPALIATLLRPFLPSKPRLIWHIRSLPYVRFREKPFRWLAQRLLAILSSHPYLTIISNSEAARAAHAALAGGPCGPAAPGINSPLTACWRVPPWPQTRRAPRAPPSPPCLPPPLPAQTKGAPCTSHGRRRCH